MGLGRKGREQRDARTAEAIDEIRQELAKLDTTMRSMVADLNTTLEAQMRITIASVERARESGVGALEHALQEFGSREEQLLDVLRQVGRSYELLAEHITADKIERRTLIDALGGAVRAVSGAVPKPRLIGGSILNATEDDVVVETETAEATEIAGTADDEGEEINLTRAEHAVQQATMQAVEVRCRFGDRWVDGFEVADVIDDGTS
ncbi:MAG TPA: hypothetical protein VFX21_05490, partial [Acidimicrobiia bacterium]|nr:hypothetical protein [Acidimicrobiia bacterium]